MKNGKIEQFIWIAILSSIVLLPNIYLAFYGSDLVGQFAKTIMFLGISLLVFLIPALFFTWRNFFLFHGIFVILSPIEIIHIALNRLPLTFAFLMDIIGTNVSEVMGLLSSTVLYIVLYCLVLIFYFVVVFTKIPKKKIFPQLKFKLIFLSIFVFYCIAGFFYYYRHLKNNIYLRNDVLIGGSVAEEKSRIFNEAMKNFTRKFHKIYPCDLILQTHELISITREVKEAEEMTKNFIFGAKKIDNNVQKEVYVFVIGEAARYKNFSINGYSRLTSPLLDKTKNIVSFSDYISEANGTVISLPLILFRADSEDTKRAMYEKSFVEAFKEAGFKTYWIANQSGTYSYIRRIAKNTEWSKILTTELGTSSNFDEYLLPFLDEVLKKDDGKALIVLHSSGSHFKYSDRHPETFDVFKPTMRKNYSPSLISPQNKNLFINAYDNSILYTDYFLSSIIRRIDSLNCIGTFVYLSDHGENLCDTKDDILFHARTIITKYDYHVPMFVWYSDEYNETYAEKVKNLRKNRQEPISARYVFYSMLDMANISFPEQIMAKSIFSEKMEADTVRYVINPNQEKLIYENLPE